MPGQTLKEMETRLEDLVEPLVREAGLYLVSVDIERRGKRLVVTVTLDKPGGIDIETCADMSEEISRYLDVENLIEESYTLEVQSPGLQRVLRKPREYKCFMGREVEVVLRQAFEGRQKLRGRLREADEKGFVISVDGEEMSFPYEAIKKTRLYFESPW